MTADDFNQTVVPMGEKLYRFAYRFLHDHEQTQDAIQEVFIKLWNQRERLGELNSMEAFAVRITRNHCLDVLRAKRTVSLDESAYLKEQITDGTDPEQLLNQSDSYQTLRGIIEHLGEPHRSVIRMKDVEGYSNEEIGDILGLSAGNIRVVLSRARKKVREEFEKVYDHESKGSKRIVAEVL